MSNSVESINLVSWIWTVLAVPLGWIVTRQQTLSAKLDKVMSEEQVKEYVELKQQPIDVKLDTLLKSTEELKQAILRLEERTRHTGD